MSIISQKTINKKVSCNGVGLHSGREVKMSLLPAPANSGIVFRRVDIADNNEILANYKNVVATNLGTTIANENGVKVATIEHLMAAIWGCEIDNLIVELDAQEIPIMDGSSASFIFLVECAGQSFNRYCTASMNPFFVGTTRSKWYRSPAEIVTCSACRLSWSSNLSIISLAIT